MDDRGLEGAADLEVLLREAGHSVSEEEIRALMEGYEWVDGHFPRWVAEVLGLDTEEMGILAYAVAYGQVEHPP